MQRCHGCMKEYGKEFDVCPHCGYIAGTLPQNKSHLRGGTELCGRYMVGKVLGYGGFGITYIAWDQKLKRTVAIKEFFPNSLSTRSEGESSVSCYDAKALRFFNDGIKKMLDEGSRLSKFSGNENIVNVYDCFEENNTAYIVMEYLEGKDLKQYLAENGGKLSPEKAVEIILPVLNALEDMHKERIIHRDIAPDNIFLCGNGKIKLLDFGSARLAVEDSEKSLSVMVKRGYAPKEQYASRSKQGPWTDVYAVCATLYKMITGSLPSESMERDIAPLESFAKFGINGFDELEKVIFKGLEPEISDRIRSVPELVKLLSASVNAKKEVQKAPQKPVALNTAHSVSAQKTAFARLDNKKANPTKTHKNIKLLKNRTEKQKIGLLVLLVIITMIVLCFFGYLSTIRGSCGPNLKWKLDSDGTLTISGTGEMKDYGFDHKGFGPWRLKAKTVIIEEGVTSVGDSAFRQAFNVTSVSLPSTLTKIGALAFQYCPIEEIELPKSVAYIGGRAFEDCRKLKTINIPESIEHIGVQIFGGCSSLETVYYNAISCKEIASLEDEENFIGEAQLFDDGFSGTVLIGEKVNRIPNRAFRNSDITEIFIPKSVMTIGTEAFYNCQNLTDVYYEGDENQWSKIPQDHDSSLLYAIIHYNSNYLQVNEEEINNSNTPKNVRLIYEYYLNSTEAEKYYEPIHLSNDDFDIYGSNAYDGEKQTHYFDLDNDGTEECILVLGFPSVDSLPYDVVYVFDLDEEVRLVDSSGTCGPHRTQEKFAVVETDEGYLIHKYYTDPHELWGTVYSYDGENFNLIWSYDADDFTDTDEDKVVMSTEFDFLKNYEPDYLSMHYDNEELPPEIKPVSKTEFENIYYNDYRDKEVFYAPVFSTWG